MLRRLERWPLFGPAFLLFVLPFAHVTALRSLGLAATFGTAAWYLHRPERQWPPLIAVFAIWLAAALLSLPTAIDPAYSLSDIKFDIGFSFLVFFGSFAAGVQPGGFELLRRAATVSLALISAMAIASWLIHGEWVIGYHNALGEFATYVVTILPLVLLGFAGGGHKERVFTGAAIALALAASLANMSRALWVVLVAMALLYGLWMARRKGLLAGAVLFSIGALAVAQHLASARGVSLFDLVLRRAIFEHALTSIQAHPWLGTGFGREANRAWYGILAERLPHNLQHPHNIFLSYADQMGLPGLAALGAIFTGPWLLFARMRNNVKLRALGIAGGVLLVAVLLKSLTDMFFYGQNLLIFWAAVGALCGRAALISKEAP